MLGFSLLWHGDLDESEAALQSALELAEQIGDVSLQARCLAYLAVTYRRQNHTVETEAYARRGLTVAEAAKMLEYVGANQANLAWVAWRRADPSQAERLAQVALESWRAFPMAYPFYWQALLPLLSIALHINSLNRAVEFAQRIVDPQQQKMPDPIEPLIQQAISAWQAEDEAMTQRLLADVIDHAHSFGYL